LKQLQEAVGNTMEHKGIGIDFLNRTPMAQHLKEWRNGTASNWRASAQQKKQSPDSSQPTECENVFASYLSDKGLISIIYREVEKLNPQRTNIPMKKWVHKLNR
jgi:hypothetical protein